MEKKEYQTPKMKVVEIAFGGILCGSTGDPFDPSDDTSIDVEIENE